MNTLEAANFVVNCSSSRLDKGVAAPPLRLALSLMILCFLHVVGTNLCCTHVSLQLPELSVSLNPLSPNVLGGFSLLLPVILSSLSLSFSGLSLQLLSLHIVFMVS